MKKKHSERRKHTPPAVANTLTGRTDNNTLRR